jgi:hypothetical protein
MGVEQLDIVIEMAVRTKEMNEPIDVASLNLEKLSEEVSHVTYVVCLYLCASSTLPFFSLCLSY